MTGSDVTRGAAALEPLTQTVRTSAAAAETKTAAAESGPALGTDQARLSAAGALFAGDSDVRFSKVAALQASIAAGTYNVPADAVADKLIDSLTR